MLAITGKAYRGIVYRPNKALFYFAIRVNLSEQNKKAVIRVFQSIIIHPAGYQA